MKDLPESVDKDIFKQILDMDEDDPDQIFSKEIVFGFFEQVQDSLKKMHESMYEYTPSALYFRLLHWRIHHSHWRESGDLKKLSAQGHYLKGSSATIGLKRIRDACEVIQSLELNANTKETMDLAKKKISVIKEGCDEAEKDMKKFYGVHAGIP